MDQPPFPRASGERLLFVGGTPRSGTTLLQHVLDSHPDVFGGPEFDVIPAIIKTWLQVAAARDRGRIAVYGTRAQMDSCFAGLIENLLLPVADAHGARLLSEKTPFNVLVFGPLLTLLPKCRAIHMVRDPRAVVSSMLQVGVRCRDKSEPAPAFTQDIETAIQFTKDSLAAGFEAQQAFADRVLTLTYESLVSDPFFWVNRICSFLEVPFAPQMLEPHARKHPDQDALVRLDNGTWLDPALGFRAIERSRIAAWEKDLQPAQIELVNTAFRDFAPLRLLGYSPS